MYRRLLSAAAFGLASQLAASGGSVVARIAAATEAERKSKVFHSPGSKPVPGGGKRERERRLRRMQKESDKCG